MRALIFVALGVAAVLVAAAAWLYSPDKPRAALEARYAGPPSQFIEAAGVRLHVRDTGPKDAPAVILLHGFGASLQTWENWAQALQADYRVIRFDLPGFGLTGPDPTGDYTDARSIAVLLALMDKLDVGRASIVGNSMGGRIAWMFAARHSERVETLVLVDPDGYASQGRQYGVAPTVPLMVRMLPYVLPTAMLRATLAAAYANPTTLTDELLARYRDMMLAPGVRDAIVARMGQDVIVDPEPLLRSIKTPTLLIWGEKDAMIPYSNAANYMRALPHATLLALPDVGHLAQEEAPARSVDAVRAFLAKPIRSPA